MKLSVIVLLVYIFSFIQQRPENYYVVHIKGEIMNKSTNKTIKLQDKLSSSDELTFVSPDAKVMIYSSDKGRFILDKASAKKINKPSAPVSEYVKIVKTLYIPSNNHLGTRSIDFQGISDLEDFFGVNTFVFIGDVFKFRVDRSSYPMSGGKYFVYRYSYGGKDYNKRVNHSGDTLIFDKEQLYTIDGKTIKPEDAGKADIYYFNNKTSPLKITTLLPVFVPEDKLKAEMQAMLAILKTENLSKEQVLNKLYEHVVLVYGNTNKKVFDEWLSNSISF